VPRVLWPASIFQLFTTLGAYGEYRIQYANRKHAKSKILSFAWHSSNWSNVCIWTNMDYFRDAGELVRLTNGWPSQGRRNRYSLVGFILNISCLSYVDWIHFRLVLERIHFSSHFSFSYSILPF